MQNYVTLRKIGKGSFGEVTLCRRRTDNKIFVIKRMKIGSVSSKEREMCHLEVRLLQRLSHPGIVTYEESFTHTTSRDTYMCVVMQYCEGGDLTVFLKKQRGRRLKEKQLLDLFIHVALALHFVHNREILHRDLKTQNIFIKDGQLKLGDFGISKVLGGPVNFAQTVIGTPYYMSPELVKNRPYDYKSDVWALGCVLYELTTLKHAFDANSLNGLAGKIVRGKYPPISFDYSKDLRNMIAKMLSSSPNKRPSIRDILQLPFLRKSIRRYVRSVIEGHEKGTCSQKAYDNLREQLTQIGQSNLIEEIRHSIEVKNQKQKTKISENEAKRQLEKEEAEKNKIADVLHKLREERRWRIEQRKQKKKLPPKSPTKPSYYRNKAQAKAPSDRYGANRKKSVAKQSRKSKVSESARRKQSEKESSKKEVQDLNLWEAHVRGKEKHCGAIGAAARPAKASHDSASAQPVPSVRVNQPPVAVKNYHLHLDPKDKQALSQLRRRRENMQNKLNKLQRPRRKASKSPGRQPSYARQDEDNRRGAENELSPQKRMMLRKKEKADQRAREMQRAIQQNQQLRKHAVKRELKQYHPYHDLQSPKKQPAGVPFVSIDEPDEEVLNDLSDQEHENAIEMLQQTLLEQSRHLEALKQTLASRDINEDANEVDSESERDNVSYVLSNYQELTSAEEVPEKSEDDVDEEEFNVVPVGRLADRIRMIRERCLEGLGKEGFKRAYSLLKNSGTDFDSDGFDRLHEKMKLICPKNMSKKRIWNYRNLIDQLLFIEENQ